MPIQPFLPGMGGAAGAHQMGHAHGRISIDTSPLRRGLVEVRRVGQQMGLAFNGVRTTIANLNADITKMRRELMAVSAGAGVLTGLGLREARTLRQYRVTFAQLLGSEEEARKLMERLTDQANQFGIEVGEVWQLGRALIPVLEDGAATLDEWVTRAALLASTNPLKGTRDAVRAIQEYLAGQPRSLQFLFNVDPNLIQEAKRQYEGVGQQLDFILRRMGATEAAALEMANAWVGVRNELKLVLAEGFTPLLQELRPILEEFREWLATLRETRPELLNLGAGLTVFAGAASSTLLILNQVLGALQKIKGLSILPALGQAGVYAGALAVGTWAGIGISREIGRRTGREDMAQTTLKDVWRLIRQSLVIIVDRISKALVEMTNNLARSGNKFVQTLASLVETMASVIEWIEKRIPGLKSSGRAEEARQWAADLRERSDAWLSQFITEMRAGQRESMRQLVRDLFPNLLPDSAAAATQYEVRRDRLVGGGGGAAGAAGYTEDQLTAIQQWHDQREQIIEDTERQINEITQQYESQRADLIRDFNQTMAREAEDWARQQRRAQEQLQRNIADVYEDRADREAEWAEELGERITEMQENAHRQLQDLQEEHRLTLMDAAARLDARAVAQEQRRYRQRRREINDDLERRIEQEKEAHAERLEDAREADEERIKDMKEAFEEQRRIAEEDRRIRLQRMREDHEQQLRELDAQHTARVNQIRRQGWEEREQLDHEFQLQLIQLELHQDAWLDAQESGQDASLRAFRLWWAEMEGVIRAKTRLGIIGGMQAGGPVMDTGAYMLHGTQSRPEYVLSADTTRMLQGALGGSFTQNQLVGAVAGGSSRSSLVIQSGAISMPIYGAAGQSAADIGEEVRAVLTDLFSRLVGAPA